MCFEIIENSINHGYLLSCKEIKFINEAICSYSSEAKAENSHAPIAVENDYKSIKFILEKISSAQNFEFSQYINEKQKASEACFEEQFFRSNIEPLTCNIDKVSKILKEQVFSGKLACVRMAMLDILKILKVDSGFYQHFYDNEMKERLLSLADSGDSDICYFSIQVLSICIAKESVE
jgi:hypothetical protein